MCILVFGDMVKVSTGRLRGVHSLLLTYGAARSGKTFSLLGLDEDPGLLPRRGAHGAA